MEEKIIEFKKRGKIKRLKLTKEAIALKRLRIIKKITRAAAGTAIEASERTIERLENGRAQLSESRIKKLLRRYKVSHEEFKNILEGKIILPDMAAHTVHKRIGKGNYKRRFDTKKITKEVRVLKCLREMKGLSQSDVASLCGCHRKSIGHIENGRVYLTEKRIRMYVKACSATMDDYFDLLEQDILRDEVIKECLEILKTIEADKLKAVSALLVNFK
ncbi:MAG: transcriptional regulator [Bdellovibrionales bacterium]|nr:transcriptional regulator [Bdellovibrionales bacterium]